ncbi:MAG: vWA domain-containing protein [Flavobacteriales bacterium]
MKKLNFHSAKLKALCCAAMLFVGVFESCSQPPVPTNDTFKRKIKLALLLDTSNSMDGLINQAKSQLWKVVNSLSAATCNGTKPDIEIAIYEYGNTRLSAQSDYIRKVSALTSDLDKISNDLFSLTTSGGDEYCGHVIQTALNELAWNADGNDLQIIFIAGNEPFTQGTVSYTTACANAKAKGIIVNTIFCGDFNEGINTDWKKGADIAGGSYMSINQNSQTTYIATPYDDKISALNDSLNTTYIGYGQHGAAKKQMQVLQDANANSYGLANKAERAVSKSKSVYKNSSWDLVDAVKYDSVHVESIKDEELSTEMKQMTVAQRKVYVEEKSKKRSQINSEIEKLNTQRTQYISAEQAKTATAAESLDNSLLKAVKEQAVSKKFVFEESK